MSPPNEPHHLDLRVYYEDTDLAGIVYYANYLKYIERARSEWVRGLGVDQVAMKADQGLVFAVYKLEATYRAPARFDDQLQVSSTVQQVTASRLTLRQDVMRDAELLFESLVTLVCLTNEGRPARLPAEIRAIAPDHG